MPEELDLREALDAAVETHSEPEPANEVSEHTATPEDTEVLEQQDGEAPVEPEQAKADADGEKPAPEKAAVPAEPEAKQHRVDRAPQSWKKEAKGEWAALPLHVRQEVYRREQQVERALQEAAPARQIAEQFQQTVAPYMARINSFGIPPTQAVQQLLAADYQLATSDKNTAAHLMAKLINDYHIDIAALDDALSVGQQQQVDPQQQLVQRIEQSLMQRLSPVLNFAQQQQLSQQQEQQRVQQEATQSVEQMSLDPKYPYFDEVREEMADLIEVSAKRGVYLTPEQAYTKAIQLNPDVSLQLGQQQTMNHANNVHQQALRAKAAASSVSGSPVGGSNMTVQGDGSLRGAIEAAFGGARV